MLEGAGDVLGERGDVGRAGGDVLEGPGGGGDWKPKFVYQEGPKPILRFVNSIFSTTKSGSRVPSLLLRLSGPFQVHKLLFPLRPPVPWATSSATPGSRLVFALSHLAPWHSARTRRSGTPPVHGSNATKAAEAVSQRAPVLGNGAALRRASRPVTAGHGL